MAFLDYTLNVLWLSDEKGDRLYSVTEQKRPAESVVIFCSMDAKVHPPGSIAAWLDAHNVIRLSPNTDWNRLIEDRDTALAFRMRFT